MTLDLSHLEIFQILSTFPDKKIIKSRYNQKSFDIENQIVNFVIVFFLSKLN